MEVGVSQPVEELPETLLLRIALTQCHLEQVPVIHLLDALQGDPEAGGEDYWEMGICSGCLLEHGVQLGGIRKPLQGKDPGALDEGEFPRAGPIINPQGGHG